MKRKEQNRQLEDLCRSYIGRLRTFVELNFPNLQEETDDTVQSILEKVVLRYHSFNQDYSLSTWIYSIARHHCIDLFRKQKRIEKHRHEGGVPENWEDPQENPEKEWEEQWKRHQLKEIFLQLPSEERQVLYLSIYEELKLSEIARILQKPLGSVKTLKHRAKQKIKNIWEAEYVR